MNGNGQSGCAWGYAVEGKPSTMLQIALRSMSRNGTRPELLPECNGNACGWVRQVAECLRSGRCRAAVLFCSDAGLACFSNGSWSTCGVRTTSRLKATTGAGAVHLSAAIMETTTMRGGPPGAPLP